MVEIVHDNPQIRESTAWGLSFVALAMTFTSAEISAHNSSTFSYSSFIKTAEDEQRARDAVNCSILWATLGNAAVGLMGYVATGQNWKWGLGTFLAGEIILALHIWHFETVLRENRVRYNYTYPDPNVESKGFWGCL